MVLSTAGKKGWFWYIPLHDDIVSVGVVAGYDYLFDGQRPPIRRAAPRLGEHNLEVYGELGLSPAEVVSLRAAGVV